MDPLDKTLPTIKSIDIHDMTQNTSSNYGARMSQNLKIKSTLQAWEGANSKQTVDEVLNPDINNLEDKEKVNEYLKFEDHKHIVLPSVRSPMSI